VDRKLTIGERVLIKARGRVSVTIRYEQIEIECGGQISGSWLCYGGHDEFWCRRTFYSNLLSRIHRFLGAVMKPLPRLATDANRHLRDKFEAHAAPLLPDR
jgi:hypothetical protein